MSGGGTKGERRMNYGRTPPFRFRVRLNAKRGEEVREEGEGRSVIGASKSVAPCPPVAWSFGPTAQGGNHRTVQKRSNRRIVLRGEEGDRGRCDGLDERRSGTGWFAVECRVRLCRHVSSCRVSSGWNRVDGGKRLSRRAHDPLTCQTMRLARQARERGPKPTRPATVR